MISERGSAGCSAGWISALSRRQRKAGGRDRLIGREDRASRPAAWAHAAGTGGGRPPYHRRSTEPYDVLGG
jgi:hypothetical protein